MDDEADVLPPSGIPLKLAAVLQRRASVIDALIVLLTIAAAFVVLGYLARYFSDYFHLILIFFFAWLLAFLISPPADFVQRRLPHLPRPIAVLAIIVPVILAGAWLVIASRSTSPTRSRTWRRPCRGWSRTRPPT